MRNNAHLVEHMSGLGYVTSTEAARLAHRTTKTLRLWARTTPPRVQSTRNGVNWFFLRTSVLQAAGLPAKLGEDTP